VSGRTVILANGAFPRKGGEARRLLASAARIVACDGAADVLWRRMRRRADFVIGDFDSIKRKPAKTLDAHQQVVCVLDQNTNDLTKAIDFCRTRGWKNLVIVGATGKREDHSLGNVFRAMEAGIEVVTDEGVFIPAENNRASFRIRLSLAVGSPISVFTTDTAAKMNSSGLEWPLEGVEFRNLYCATLNRTSAKRVEIKSSSPFFAFVVK